MSYDRTYKQTDKQRFQLYIHRFICNEIKGKKHFFELKKIISKTLKNAQKRMIRFDLIEKKTKKAVNRYE